MGSMMFEKTSPISIQLSQQKPLVDVFLGGMALYMEGYGAPFWWPYG